MNACDINVPVEDLRGNKLKPFVDRAFEWANWFLMRYRDYAQAYFIQPVHSYETDYAVSYYPVHGTKPVGLEDTSSNQIESPYLTLETWEGIAHLDRSYETPPWIHLLLDARFAAHPGVGVVLAWAALEMVIDHALGTRNKNYAREQNTEKQYTVLLKHLGWRSLKEEEALWRSFKDLQELRHQFAHGRELRLNGKPVPKQRVAVLICCARDIVAFVNEQLPPQSRWRMFPKFAGAYGGYVGMSVGAETAIA